MTMAALLLVPMSAAFHGAPARMYAPQLSPRAVLRAASTSTAKDGSLVDVFVPLSPQVITSYVKGTAEAITVPCNADADGCLALCEPLEGCSVVAPVRARTSRHPLN